MTLTAPAPPAPHKPPREHDPRNPVHRLPALLDEGSVTFLGPDDGSGMRAATGTVDLPAVVLFLIIFMWTPPHFWALALFRSGDYAKAGVPMLPVVAGDRETRRQIVLYSLLLLPLTLLPTALGIAGMFYLAGAGALGALLVAGAVQVWRESGDKTAKLLFGYSVLYLFLLFALMLISGNDAATFPVGLLTFVSKFSVDFGQMMAAGVLALILACLFFLLIQRYLVQGLTAGAVKG